MQEPTSETREPKLFAPGPLKFTAMSLCTFGLYLLYWSYKNWKYIQARDAVKIMPFWRAVFYPIWHYFLLSHLSESLKPSMLSSLTLRIILMLYVLLAGLTWRLDAPFWLISQFVFLGFLPAVFAIKQNVASRNLTPKESTFYPPNAIAYVLGGPCLCLILLMGIGYFPDTRVVDGSALWDRDTEFLREAEILGADEEILFFYSAGPWSIKEDGQFVSTQYVTSYYQDTDTGQTHVNFAPFSDITDIHVEWSKNYFDQTIVTVSAVNDYQFVLWLSPESGGDRDFVQELNSNWANTQNGQSAL